MAPETHPAAPRADLFSRRIGYQGFLLVLLADHVLGPALIDRHLLLGLMRFAELGVLVLAVAFARRRAGELVLAGTLLAVAVVGELGSGGHEGWSVAAAAARLVFELFIAALVLRELSSHPVVTFGTISGAFVVYLLLAGAFAEAYDLVDRADPGAAIAGIAAHEDVATPQERLARREELTYFSLVTWTTLGYGDLAPRAPLARSLATLEALLGQAYLAVLIARLVSLYRPAPPRGAAGPPSP